MSRVLGYPLPPSIAELEGRLYFAYGSNMDEGQMRARVPGAVFVSTAVLPGHEFLFSGWSHTWGGSVANVRPKKGKSVFGIVYALPPDGIERLDRFEGYPVSYQRKRAKVTLSKNGRKVRAVLYYKRRAKAEGPPSPAYVAQLTRALRRHGASSGGTR